MSDSLRLGRFEFGPTRARISGNPPIEEWEGPLSFALWCQRASPWWIGDLLNLGDEGFGEFFFQICEGYGVSAEMVQRYKSVSRRVPPANRRPGLSWSAHAVAARLPVDKQRAALLEAEKRGWTSDELRQHLRKQAQLQKDQESEIAQKDPADDFGAKDAK